MAKCLYAREAYVRVGYRRGLSKNANEWNPFLRWTSAQNQEPEDLSNWGFVSTLLLDGPTTQT